MSKEEDFFSLEALYFSAKEEVTWGEVKGHYFGNRVDGAYFPADECSCVCVLKQRRVPKLQRAAAAGLERVEGLEVLQQKCNYSLVLIGSGGVRGIRTVGSKRGRSRAISWKCLYTKEHLYRWGNRAVVGLYAGFLRMELMFHGYTRSLGGLKRTKIQYGWEK